MQFKNTIARYGLVAILLHWVIAFLVVGLLCVGLYMVSLHLGTQKTRLYGWHKEFGLLVFFLVIFRVFWRLFNISPLLPASIPAWQRFSAHIVHWALIGFLFAMPITGWLLTSSAGFKPSFFGLFDLPLLISPDDDLRHLFAEIHEWIAYGLIATICLHVGAALQHHYIDKDDILRRMLP